MWWGGFVQREVYLWGFPMCVGGVALNGLLGVVEGVGWDVFIGGLWAMVGEAGIWGNFIMGTFQLWAIFYPMRG
ncbi:hypothetical protein CAQU_10380 [Corynebacterium aquilae DSM 44791]|uniref:Uncharacterized protein n=1 Tax=Corynebacterium aquilae DSM 44791 TaxID=1431546 RepID=A0A1L7CHU2_9CORY|nr:hypothetical protein CAQU_10380 [Corynebacterium aquilae DSM 44791]